MGSIEDRTFDFSVAILGFYRNIPKDYTCQVIARQLVRAGTSIGANVTEGRASASKKDFINFHYHALKSARETIYWLRLLHVTLLQEDRKSECLKLTSEATEISKIIGKIVITARKNSATR